MGRVAVSALIVLLIAGLNRPAPASDPALDWLPPLPNRPPFWEWTDPVPPPDGPEFVFSFHWSYFGIDGMDDQRGFQVLFGRYRTSSQASLDALQLQSRLDLPALTELREIPSHPTNWTAEESLTVPLAHIDSLFMFGQVNTRGDAVNDRQTALRGKTGLGWKWSPIGGSELQVRTGPLLNLDDIWQTQTLDRSQWSVELQAKVALYGPLQLQYAGEALPALSPTERHSLLHDLKMAVPFGPNREVHLGAKYLWEESLSPTPWVDRTQLYMGLRIQR